MPLNFPNYNLRCELRKLREEQENGELSSEKEKRLLELQTRLGKKWSRPPSEPGARIAPARRANEANDSKASLRNVESFGETLEKIYKSLKE
jgi:hypothetical protein